MAKPRIFISSTFYDLRQVRSDLDRFIKELGYEPVLNELGNIAYGKDEKLEEYCYKEISNVDILVSIVGGRYGSESQHQNVSISQMEFKTALELNKQVYIFIDKNVNAEYQTYLLNKKNKEIKYRFADNIKIYEFIEFLENLPNNNNIHSFESSLDIVQYLKEQWAGLFQRFLAEQPRIKEISLLKGIEGTAKTLNQLVSFLTEERKDRDSAIQDILLSNHPAMEEVRSKLNVNYRVYFISKDELTEWLSARGYKYVDPDFLFNDDDYYEYIHTDYRLKKKFILKVKKDIFNDDGKLKVFTKIDWRDNFIILSSQDLEQSQEDDLPF
ncbi:hypothetical protein MYP_5008 [Sporocytophaga myxococcoides]|uniref:DUF4062 domain-containing protein n=1 Tax=Sporocytophaga myxococcoides TaxID=153721 RepID=A0A098LN80_9BACT|nr:DUF4062 domain-containing protein [Sporocytophaga myxococcoides]GAL87777.1 hypothetical protein MYP_5008 [Sporocytophaga myxococcoides]